METINIVKAEYAGNLSVKIWFDDNTTQTVNISEFVNAHPHPPYDKYLDEQKFKKFEIENVNVVWGANWDLVFPLEQLYSRAISWKV